MPVARKLPMGRRTVIGNSWLNALIRQTVAVSSYPISPTEYYEYPANSGNNFSTFYLWLLLLLLLCFF